MNTNVPEYWLPQNAPSVAEVKGLMGIPLRIFELWKAKPRDPVIQSSQRAGTWKPSPKLSHSSCMTFFVHLFEIGLKYLVHCGLIHHVLAFILNRFAIVTTRSGVQHSAGYAVRAVLISPASTVSAVFNPHSLAKYLKAVTFSVLTRELGCPILTHYFVHSSDRIPRSQHAYPSPRYRSGLRPRCSTHCHERRERVCRP